MYEAMNILNEREKSILHARKLSENAATLDTLSKKHNVSRERIRQIETKAFEKLQKSMLTLEKSRNLLPKK
jgi:RNA polymerase sigma-32 factor